MLMFLGLVSAAAVMPLALLLSYVPPLAQALNWLSPLVTVCGLPALAVGLLFWRCMTDREFAGLQTAGISIGVVGAFIMAASVVLAWPQPATLLPTALALGLAMTAVAILFDIPAAHIPGGIAFAVAWLIGFHLVRGDIGWQVPGGEATANALLSYQSGHMLEPLFVVFGIVAWQLSRLRRADDGLMYGLVAAATALASVALVLWFGFARVGDPANATWRLPRTPLRRSLPVGF